MDQLNRPKTRGLEASEADEDAKLIRAALKEPSKFIKKAHQKLKHDYSGDNVDDSDEEQTLFYQQPPYDDEEKEVKPSAKRKRGGGRRGNVRRQKKYGHEGTEDEMKKHTVSARLAAMLKEELKPIIIPFNGSMLQYKQIWYKIGDIVSTQKETTKYYAQILAFHTDQFCERYASIQWLLPRYNMNDTHRPPITTESFKAAVPADDPLSLNCFNFVLRPPAHYFQQENPNTVNRGKFYFHNGTKCYFDSPSSTLTSADKRY